MPSHFSTIGLPLNSRDEFAKYAELAVTKGERIKTGAGTYTKFDMGSGVELWGQLSHDNEIIGLNPHLTGTAAITVRLMHKVDDSQDNELDGKVLAEAEPHGEGSFAYPFVFDMPDMAVHRFSFPEIWEAQIAAFAHQLSIYSDDEEYARTQDGEPKFASESFIPSGLFSPDGESTDPPQAMAIFTGHVIRAEKLSNPHTGASFYYAKVKTLGGEFDVVADPQIVDREISAGNVVSGSFWLTGRLVKRSNPLHFESKNVINDNMN